MKKALVILLALVMMLTLLAACGNSSGGNAGGQPNTGGATNSGNSTGGGNSNGGGSTAPDTTINTEDDFDYSAWVDDQGRTTIKVATTADPGSFDPRVTASTAAYAVPIFDSLCRVDTDTWSLVPNIAKSWKVADDGLSIEVEIFDYVKDMEGNPLTASDVEYCLQGAKDAGVANSNTYDHTEIKDDYHFTIYVASSQVGVWTNLSTINLYTKAAYESHDFGTDFVPTGPYKLVDWVPGSTFTFEKTGVYWQTDESLIPKYDQANVDVVRYEVIKEPAQQTVALEMGNIDLVGSMSYTEASRFMEGGEDAGTHNVIVTDDILAQLLYLNMSDKSIFKDDLNLRKAVFTAIDRAGLIMGASDGYGDICVTFGCEPSSLGFNQKWYDEEYYPYDPEQAKAYLADSNYDGTELRIVSNNSDLKKSISQLIQVMLQQVGINAKVLPYEDALLNTYKNDPNEWDILLDNTSAGGEISGMWRRKFDPNNFKGDQTGANFIDDPALWDVLYPAIDMATYSQETVDAFHYALKDNWSALGLYNAKIFNVGSLVVVDTDIYHSGILSPTSSTFVWNLE